MTQPTELVAVVDAIFAMDEAALKQQVTMFDRISIPELGGLSKNTFESPEFQKTRAWLVETGILFELDVKRLKIGDPQDRMTRVNTIRDDVNFLLKPGGLSVEEAQAAAGDKCAPY